MPGAHVYTDEWPHYNFAYPYRAKNAGASTRQKLPAYLILLAQM